MKLFLRLLVAAVFMLGFVHAASAQFSISVSFGPPALPVYEQPICPEVGYLWVPGYWAYDDDDGYYWVPGTWVAAPEPGYLWTPGYWGYGDGGSYLFHEGYWATEVGFYGGINYGFGYFGSGFGGGRWEGGEFRYNTAVLNVNTTIIHNTYIDRTVINNVTINHVSYNGGEGGITSRPTPREVQVAQTRHLPPPAAQTQHIAEARSNPQLRASANQGKPPIAATARPGSFTGGNVVASRAAGAPYRPAPARGGAQPANNRAPETPGTRQESGTPQNQTHASELTAHQPNPPASTGNPKLDQKYQQQQAALAAKQNQQHEQLAQKQQQQDARVANNPAKQQQVEQQHQQQTQHLEQQHAQQQQRLQTRQAPASRPEPKR